MKYKIYEVRFKKRPQVGCWTCEIAFIYASTKQFTDETMTVTSDCYKWWIAAWWNARRSMKLYLAVNGAKRGERTKLGWSE